jgi:hypothetical protein
MYSAIKNELNKLFLTCCMFLNNTFNLRGIANASSSNEQMGPTEIFITFIIISALFCCCCLCIISGMRHSFN